MSDTQAPEDVEQKPAKIRGFKSVRSFEPVPAEPDPEPIPEDDSLSRPIPAVNGPGAADDDSNRAATSKGPTETAKSTEPNNVVLFDQSKVCPSRYFDSKTAEYTLLNDKHPDGSKRDFYMEFRYRLGNYRRDIYEGRLPPEAIFYDFPEELYDRTPKQVKEFFDQIVFSTGIGKEEPQVVPLGLHPLLFRLFRRIDSDKLEDVSRRFLLMRDDAEKIRKRREEEAKQKQDVAQPGSLSTEVARNEGGREDAAQSMPNAKPDQPMGMEGIRRRRDVATGPFGEAPAGSELRERDRSGRPSSREPVEASWRAVEERQPAAGQAPAVAGGAPVVHGSCQVGLLSGLWYGLGAAAHGLGSRFGHMVAPKDRSSSAPAAPVDSQPFPEVTNPLYRSVLDVAARDAAHGLDQDIEPFERDCRTLVDLAAWTREVATQGPVADALKGIEDLAARRGVPTDAVWKDVHAVAQGALQDREVASVAETLAKAIDSVDTQGSLSRMAEARERVESASSRILERIDREQGVDPSKAKRVEDAIGSLKDANAAFEKPGDDKEIRRIAEMARRIAEAFKRLVNRLLARGQDAEEAPAPPGP